MLRKMSYKGLLKGSALVVLFLMGLSTLESHGGLFGYAFNKFGDSPKTGALNPCDNETFKKTYGQYCTGLFTKTIQCLSDGRNPGVCDSAAVCDTLDRTVKKLCETHCLNVAPQKMGNQSIRISCAPSPNVKEAVSTDLSSEMDGKKLGHAIALKGEVQGGNKLSGDSQGKKQGNSSIREGDSSSFQGMDSSSIRETIGGSQDSEDSNANYYTTDKPREFDKINTEEPWVGSYDFWVDGNIGGGRNHGGHRPGNNFRGANVGIGGSLRQLPAEDDQGGADLESMKISNGWNERAAQLLETGDKGKQDSDPFDTFPLDEFDSPSLENEPVVEQISMEKSVSDEWGANTKWNQKADINNIIRNRFWSMPD